MLATYKGKSYWCKILSRNKIMLLSRRQTDGAFEVDKDIYRKLVNKDECDDFKTGCIYACYKNQEIETYDVDLKGKQFIIWTSSDHIYTDEFVEDILGGKRGRDIFAKCDIDKFTEYIMHTREYTTDSNGFTTTTNESKLPVSLEEVIEYLTLVNNY